MPFFNGKNPQFIASMVQNLKPETYMPCDVVCREVTSTALAPPLSMPHELLVVPSCSDVSLYTASCNRNIHPQQEQSESFQRALSSKTLGPLIRKRVTAGGAGHLHVLRLSRVTARLPMAFGRRCPGYPGWEGVKGKEDWRLCVEEGMGRKARVLGAAVATFAHVGRMFAEYAPGRLCDGGQAAC